MKYTNQREVVIDVYLPILEEFTREKISGSDFERTFLDVRDEYIDLPWDDGLYEIFNRLFFDVEDFVADQSLVTTADDIDENELRKRCAAHLQEFNKLIL